MSPNSELAWDMPVQDFVFTLYDRFSYFQDVLSVGAVSVAAQLPRFDSIEGIRAYWQPSQCFAQGVYGHQNYFSTDSDYEHLNRASEQLFPRGGHQVAQATRGGLETSAGLTRFGKFFAQNGCRCFSDRGLHSCRSAWTQHSGRIRLVPGRIQLVRSPRAG